MLTLTMMLPLIGANGAFSAADTPSGNAVSTVDEFLAMDANGVYYLAGDIDFSGKEYDKVVYNKSFRGVLDGNGHSLTGITVKGSNSDASIFGNQFGGKLCNITLGSENAPVSVTSTGGGMSVSAVAGTVVTGAIFENVTVYANVKGEGKTAGFTCYMPNGNLTIENCKVYGSITGNPASGFVCMSNDGSSNVLIKDSENYAGVTGGMLGAGGFYAVASAVGGSRTGSLTVEGCANFGGITASDWRVGGIVGEFHESQSSTLKISYCYNMAPVTMTGGGGFAAGIVGGMCFDAPSGERTLENVYNAGLIRNTANNTRAYAIAFAHTKNDKVNIRNAAYTQGTPSENCNEQNVTLAASPELMLDTVSKYTADAQGRKFIADVSGINSSYPILSTQMSEHTNVHAYECGRRVCLDCMSVLTSADEENHSFGSTVVAPEGYTDGYIKKICTHCSHTILEVNESSNASPEKNAEDGTYRFSKPEHLMWYSANVNAGLLTGKEHIILEANIDMSGLAFTPIKAGEKGFTGTFDGGYHIISNLSVDSETGGLFEKLGLGATVCNVGLEKAVIKAQNEAGAVSATVDKGAVVRLKNISVTDSQISSQTSYAGGLIGSSASCVEASIDGACCDTTVINGNTVGGALGNGEGGVLKNVYVNVTLTASSGSSGALAVYNSAFKSENCGYSGSTAAVKKDGKKFADTAFSSGEIAYLINTYGARKCFGVSNGKTAVSDDAPISLVRVGSARYYTNNILEGGADNSAYYLEGGKLVIVHKQNAKDRLVDAAIKIADKEVKFSELSLCRYAESNGTYYVAPSGYVLYVLEVEGVSSLGINDVNLTVNEVK